MECTWMVTQIAGARSNAGGKTLLECTVPFDIGHKKYNDI